VAHGTKSGLVHLLFDHAEHNACYEALWSREGPKNLRGFTVYSTLEPCLMCLSMLMTARVSRIVFACEDPYGGGTRLLENPAVLPLRFQEGRPDIVKGVLASESKALLRKFFDEQKDSPNWSNPSNPLVALVSQD
jgi:tRNA(adenine34) deaminase